MQNEAGIIEQFEIKVENFFKELNDYVTDCKFRYMQNALNDLSLQPFDLLYDLEELKEKNNCKNDDQNTTAYFLIKLEKFIKVSIETIHLLTSHLSFVFIEMFKHCTNKFQQINFDGHVNNLIKSIYKVKEFSICISPKLKYYFEKYEEDHFRSSKDQKQFVSFQINFIDIFHRIYTMTTKKRSDYHLIVPYEFCLHPQIFLDNLWQIYQLEQKDYSWNYQFATNNKLEDLIITKLQHDTNIESTPNLLKRRLSKNISIMKDILQFDNKTNLEFTQNEAYIYNSFISNNGDIVLNKNHDDSDIILDENDCTFNEFCNEDPDLKFDQNDNIEDQLQIETKLNLEIDDKIDSDNFKDQIDNENKTPNIPPQDEDLTKLHQNNQEKIPESTQINDNIEPVLKKPDNKNKNLACCSDGCFQN